MSAEQAGPVPDPRIVRCRACREPMIFLKTVTGHDMPCNADTVAADDEMYEQGKHVSHFATCPESERFRRPR